VPISPTWTSPIGRPRLERVDVHVSLLGRRDLAGEIYRQLRAAILDGRMRAGECLPPSREFARRLRVSRTTVAVAYDRLISEGFATSRAGSGTFVSANLTTPREAPPRRSEGVLRPRPGWDAVPLPPVSSPVGFDFRPGIPDARLFPYEAWRRLLVRQFRPAAVGLGAYVHPAGHLGLREAICRHFGTSRGVRAVADDVLITNGTQQALDVVARILVEPGDCVAVEDPCYKPPRLLFASLGARVRGVPVDDEGIVVQAIPGDARFVYVSPSHQFPLGLSMSLPRRLSLLDWARRHDAAIVEDDYDSEFRFDGRPIEPLQALDTSGRVIYVGTFSKTLLATLRLGFVIVPPSLRRAAHAAKFLTDWHTSLPAQAALAEFIDSGAFARHLRRMRTVYRARHERIVGTLEREFGGVLEAIPSSVGLHLGAVARSASSDEIAMVLKRASKLGVRCQTFAMYAVDTPRAGLILGYGSIDAGDIEEGLHRLRRCWGRTPESN
jgi:GntR family transcriptional regulator/MocR family aminotransferase